MIFGDSSVCGIIGYPVGHSASPRMHIAAYRELGLNWVYVPFPVHPDQLPAAIKGIRALGVKGVNVTIPFKESVIPYLDRIDDSARRMGSVNTIVNENGQLVGYSTDGDGFVLSLHTEKGLSLTGATVCLLGAGGSARSVAFALAKNGIAALCISNRTHYRADSLKNDLLATFPDLVVSTVIDGSPVMVDALRHASIIINTTPLGMSPNEDAMPLTRFDWVRPDHLVCDLIYKPFPTRFLREAQAAGADVFGGAGMLAGQGILAFKLFTGHDVAYSVMRQEV